MRLVIGFKFVVRSIVAFFFLLLFLLLPTTNYQLFAIHAQTTPVPANVSPTSPIFTDLILQNTFHSFSCLAIGQSIIGQPCLTYVSGVPVLSQANLSGGALGAATSFISMLYLNPPVRTVNYLASVGEGLGLVKPAHAQVVGSGAAVLDPILKLWQVSRNIAYLAMIIIFIIIGLMVMFRQRLNPQTVITAQAALPGLVIGLILITFSYFLAGLISDTAFIGTNLLGYYFSAAQNISGNLPLTEEASSQSVLSIMSRFINAFDKGEFKSAVEIILDALKGGPAEGFVKGAATLMAYQYGSIVGPAVGGLVAGGACLLAPEPTAVTKVLAPLCFALGQAFGGVITGGAAAGSVAVAPGPVIGIALWAIFVAIIIYTMFKLLLRLINNFLSIIFLVITAPFHFLAASLPGRQGLATNWILNMLCNVLAFPAVMAVFYFIAYLLGQGISVGLPFTVNAPLTLTGGQTFPLLGGLNLSFIKLLVAFGALVATPSIPDIICRAIGRVGQTGQLIGQEISGGVRYGQGQIGQAQGRLTGIGHGFEQVTTKWRDPFSHGLGTRLGEMKTAASKK